MNDITIQFLAVPSAMIRDAWIGVAQNKKSGARLTQTPVAFLRKDEARFAARRQYVRLLRSLQEQAA